MSFFILQANESFVSVALRNQTEQTLIRRERPRWQRDIVFWVQGFRGEKPMLGADEMAEYFELMEKAKRKEKEKEEVR